MTQWQIYMERLLILVKLAELWIFKEQLKLSIQQCFLSVIKQSLWMLEIQLLYQVLDLVFLLLILAHHCSHIFNFFVWYNFMVIELYRQSNNLISIDIKSIIDLWYCNKIICGLCCEHSSSINHSIKCSNYQL